MTAVRRLCITVLALAVLVMPHAARAADEANALDQQIRAVETTLMADPARALVLARDVAKRASAQRDARKVATAQWLEAEALLGLNRLDEAAAPALAAGRQIAAAAPRSKLAGDIQRTLGAIAAMRGDVQQALRRYQAAYRIFTAIGENRSRAIALLDIGQTYWEAGDYDRVLRYFGQARELMPAEDANLLLALHNGRGEVLRTMNRAAEAEAEFALALKAASKLKSDTLTARILTNLASAQAQGGRLAAAEASVRQAFARARGTDGAEWRPFIHGVAAQIAEKRGAIVQARAEIEAAFGKQNLAATPMPYREAHELAARVYERVGDQALAMRHLRAFQRLDKEAQTLIATNSAQLMAAQFDFTNQNLRIAQLRRGQLERDIKLERQRSRYRTNLFLGLLIAGGIILAIALYGFFSIRRSRNQVRAANAELECANGELGKALKAKSEFLATTSHEIRTPLNGILGMTQVLLADRGVDPGTREKIEVVHGAGTIMQALVDDLLDVAKLEHGELTLVEERVDLAVLIDEAARLWRPQANAKGLALVLDCDSLPKAVLTDGGRVRQILFNLLSNAVKFTLDGQVTVRCRLEEDEGAARIVLAVEDTGIGIAPEHHELVFEAFSQVDGGTTRQFSGTGLGLSIVRSLADKLGGSVALASAPGAGSTFTVRLPVALPAVEADAGEGQAESGLATASVLLVDGDPASQPMLRILLIPQARAVAVAATADEARAMLDDGAIDCVVVNVSGLGEAPDARVASLRALAGATRAAGGKLSLLQAMDQQPPISELFTLGADQLIVKPIEPAELIAALAALWSADAPAFVAPALSDGRMAA